MIILHRRGPQRHSTALATFPDSVRSNESATRAEHDKQKTPPILPKKLTRIVVALLCFALLAVGTDSGLSQQPKTKEDKPRAQASKAQPGTVDKISEKARDKATGNTSQKSLQALYKPVIGQKTPCGNGDFEGGINPMEWQGAYGVNTNINNTINFSTLTDGIVAGNGTFNNPGVHQLAVNTGWDPNGIPQTANGLCGPSNRAVRIGNAHANQGVDLLSKTFVVTAVQSKIAFWYAVVFQLPASAQLRPFFWVRVTTNGAVTPNLVDIGGTIGGSGDTGKLVAPISSINTDFVEMNSPAGGPKLLYKKWSCAQIDLSQHIGQTVTIEFVTADSGWAIGSPGRYTYAYVDNFCGDCCATPGPTPTPTSTPPPTPTDSKYCCPGPNLVKNGDFEQGNLTGTINSTYTFNGSTALYSTVAGQYNVVNSAGALAISPNWVVNDHAVCNGFPGSKFMVVNGKTTQGTGSTAVIWQQTVNVKAGKEYRFCFNVKNLVQSTFDTKPILRVTFTNPVSATINWFTVNEPTGACNWRLVDKTFNAATTGPLTIRIWLDQATPKDGNDLALADIALHENTPLPEANVMWSPRIVPLGGGQFKVEATYPPNTLTAPCQYAWLVGEVTGTLPNLSLLWNTVVINPPAWQTYPAVNWFNGYNGTNTLVGNNPGIFLAGKTYRIIFAARCDCNEWTPFGYDFTPQPPGAPRPPGTSTHRVARSKLSERDMRELRVRLNPPESGGR